MKKENQFTILEEATGLVLYCKKDNIVGNGQIAIEEMCTLSNPEFKDIYWDFENKLFYIQE